MESLNNFCRLCGAVLRGNHRRWLFSRSGGGSRPDLQVVLSYVLSREPPQRGDGRGEFLCGKCAQALGRVYRFDTVIARVQALSIDRLQRLLSEKDQLARTLRHIHTQRFPDDAGATFSYVGQEISASIADLPHVRYQRLLQDDMALSQYECWAGDADGSCPGAPCRSRQCRSCHGLRVEDSDYEWVCQTPRRLGVLSPGFPLCRDKSQSMPTVHRSGSRASLRSQSLGDTESCSMLSLDTLPEPDVAWEALRALRGIERKRLRVPTGSKIPVLARNRHVPTPRRESSLGEEAFEEMVDEFLPLEAKFQAQQMLLHQDVQGAYDNLKQRLEAAEEELRSFQEKLGEDMKPEAEISPEVKAASSQERLIQRLAMCLQSKERALQDCLILLQSLGPSGVKSSMLEAQIKQMTHRLKERDQALEKTLSGHFLALESVHHEVRHLQEALKDKDADLSRLGTALRTGEETLHALREVLHQKDREIQRLESLSASTRGSWQQRDQTLLLALKEKEALIKALQEALASSTKDVEALANSLGSPDFAPGLLQRIQEKEDLLARSLAEQEEIRAQWQRRLEAVEDAASATEQELQEQLRRHSQDARERAQEAEKLRRRLTQAEAELTQGAVALEEHRAEVARLQRMEAVIEQVLEEALREAEEKDRVLQKLQELWLKRMRQVPGREIPGQTLLPSACSPSLAPD
nr:rootletin-like [Zootoca vivipara]XP_034963019.1 rootletin-like [Zootoca vivipara]